MTKLKMNRTICPYTVIIRFSRFKVQYLYINAHLTLLYRIFGVVLAEVCKTYNFLSRSRLYEDCPRKSWQILVHFDTDDLLDETLAALIGIIWNETDEISLLANVFFIRYDQIWNADLSTCFAFIKLQITKTTFSLSIKRLVCVNGSKHPVIPWNHNWNT